MSINQFSVEDLREIANAADRELAYWQSLFGLQAASPPPLTPGAVAVVLEVALARGLVALARVDFDIPLPALVGDVAPPFTVVPPSTVAAPATGGPDEGPRPRGSRSEPQAIHSNGHHAPIVSAAPAVVAPAAKLPRTLAEVDADARAAMLREILAELQMLAQDGKMPTQAVWNECRPGHLPKAADIYYRYDLTWSQLAGYAKLDFKERGKRKANELAA